MATVKRSALLAGFLLAAGLFFAGGAWAADAPGPGALWTQTSIKGFDRAAAAARIDAALKVRDEHARKVYELGKRAVKGEDVGAERARLAGPPSLKAVKEDALRVVKADATDQAAAKAIRVILLTYFPVSQGQSAAQLRAHVRQVLIDHHANDPYLLDATELLKLGPGQDVEFWRQVYDRTTNPRVRGNAAAVLIDANIEQLANRNLPTEERARLRERTDVLLRAMNTEYAKVPVGPNHKLPRYIDKRTATLSDFARNRQTLLDYSGGVKLAGIEVADLDGKPDRLDNYRGRIVVLDFWATWCGPCRAGHPGLVALKKEMAGKPFEIIGISVDEKASAVKKYMAEVLDMPWVQWHIGPRGKLLEEWSVQGFPTYLVVNAEGVVVERTSHFDDGNLATVRKLVAAQLPAP